MAKSKLPEPEQKKPLFPSNYGSHKSMIDTAATDELNQDGKVVCRDEHGTYITDYNRLDTGLADPNRYSKSRNIALEKEKKD